MNHWVTYSLRLLSGAFLITLLFVLLLGDNAEMWCVIIGVGSVAVSSIFAFRAFKLQVKLRQKYKKKSTYA